MGDSYTQLTEGERKQIYALLQAEKPQRKAEERRKKPRSRKRCIPSRLIMGRNFPVMKKSPKRWTVGAISPSLIIHGKEASTRIPMD